MQSVFIIILGPTSTSGSSLLPQPSSLLTPQVRENSPSVSPTANSTAPFGLKPRSGMLTSAESYSELTLTVPLGPLKCLPEE